jgi:hypothetical protein
MEINNMVIDTLQAASQRADSIHSLSSRLRNLIDSARKGRGLAGDAVNAIDQILTEAKVLRKELARAA